MHKPECRLNDRYCPLLGEKIDNNQTLSPSNKLMKRQNAHSVLIRNRVTDVYTKSIESSSLPFELIRKTDEKIL